MQSWEDYEADYYGGNPEGRMRAEWESDDHLCPVDRWGNRMCAGDRGMGRMNPRDGQWEMGEKIREDLDEFESLFDDAAMEILRVIREMCDAMGGDGCIAMDGRMDRALVDMMVDRVIEEMDRMNEVNGAELSGVNVNRDQDIRRSWISALLFHELLRRRMNRHRRRRNRPDFRDRWKR